ncbi:MAG: glycine cleavage system protein GcvH [Eubacterium sp.]|jgi:glycine cleavage system H protein|nr:glycine cleavage system protein GcvH [Eubacterium sp.]MCH4046923.1 glycine cleavage system protein GcvH [Eubacterium sp.]MCH4080020.1 glycine cleavage system protein GcvH [Eubacterium sp.]MCH4109938.1 glycine cleavage system protein GcvH [Eubacterium sp.]MCI1307959.1 glycine cleavage system protein GcvH [Eubacterium sp.]
MSNPQDLKYSKSHEWVRIDGDTAYIGITDHAQESLGDLVFVNLPEVDDEITAGDPFGDVESVKAVSDLIAPVDGVVAEINEELLDAPEKINEEPYDAWMIKITEIGDTDELLDADDYERFVEEEDD